MQTVEEYANTYGLSAGVTQKFLSLNPGEATRVINAIAGNHVAVTEEELKKQLNIIQSEVKEGFDNLEAGTLEGLRDDAMDIVFTGYGLANRLGVPADLDYRDVVLSNVCKFDTNEAGAIKTRDKYLALGVITNTLRSEYAGEVYFVTKVAHDQVGSDGKSYPAGKWLKSWKWVDCQYQGFALSPVVGEKQFNVHALNLLDRQTMKDVLIKIAANYEDLEISETLAGELQQLISKAVRDNVQCVQSE